MAENLSVPFEPQFQHTTTLQLEDGQWMIESHCPTCGAFVAASPNIKLILIAERCHSCAELSEGRRTA